jgi:cell division protein FtsL
MATMPAFLRKNELPAAPAPAPEPVTRAARPRAERDPFRLRPLPHDDIFFYCKRIDNSRLVREADPHARGACWSAIGAACLLLVLLTSAFAPTAMTTLAGYKLEALHAEERRLLEERRNLDLQEAELLSPARLDQLARQNNLMTPSSNQVIHLDKPEGEVAMVK